MKYVNSKIQETLIAQLSVHWSLTTREQDVLNFLASGTITSKDIAHELGCAASTVNVHIENICRKSKTNGRMDLLGLWLNYISNILNFLEYSDVSHGTCYISEDDENICEYLAELAYEIGYKPIVLSDDEQFIKADPNDMVIYDLSYETKVMDRVLTSALTGSSPAVIAITGNELFLQEKGHKFYWDKLIMKPFSVEIKEEMKKLSLEHRIKLLINK